MAYSIDQWSSLKNRDAIGEVFGIDGDNIDIFVYPEYLPWIRIGDILAVETDWGYAIGIVLNASYRAQRSFRVLKMRLETLRKNVPDIYRFHLLLTRMIYTSRFEGGRVIHMRGGTPMLHALTYKLDEELLNNFLFLNGKLNLSFLKRYIEAGAGPEAIKHFIDVNRDVLFAEGEERFLNVLLDVLTKIEDVNIISYIKAVSDYMGWI